jgi:hypothetical protein
MEDQVFRLNIGLVDQRSFQNMKKKHMALALQYT